MHEVWKCLYASIANIIIVSGNYMVSLIARFMGPTWGPSGADRTQVGPLLAPWTLLSGICLVASLYLIKCWGVISWVLDNTIRGPRSIDKRKCFSSTKCISECYLQKFETYLDLIFLRYISFILFVTQTGCVLMDAFRCGISNRSWQICISSSQCQYLIRHWEHTVGGF